VYELPKNRRARYITERNGRERSRGASALLTRDATPAFV
jgi:hypothetical protein